MGAGDRKLEKLIPSTAGYIPVDCTNALPGTFVVDFNIEFRLAQENFNVFLPRAFSRTSQTLKTSKTDQLSEPAPSDDAVTGSPIVGIAQRRAIARRSYRTFRTCRPDVASNNHV
jgi:hypothetical protein